MLCHNIPLIAELILPHKIRLLKFYFPQYRHVWVYPYPQQRRISTERKYKFLFYLFFQFHIFIKTQHLLTRFPSPCSFAAFVFKNHFDNFLIMFNMNFKFLTMSNLYGSFFNKFIYLFIYLFLAVLGLWCCTRAFSSCSERELLFVAVCGLLSSRWLLLLHSVGSSAGFSSCGMQASVVMACRRSEERRVGKECRSRWSPYH